MGKKRGGGNNQEQQSKQQSQRQPQQQSQRQSQQPTQQQSQRQSQQPTQQATQPPTQQPTQRQPQQQNAAGPSKSQSQPQTVASASTALQDLTLKPSQEIKTGASQTVASGQVQSRGGTRNARNIDTDCLIKTRPETLNTKQGTLGTKVNLRANYFRLTDSYGKGLNQYHVYFTPELETRQRKQIIARNKQRFGGYIFDGTKIYTKMSFDDVEFTAKSEVSDELIKVNVRFVGVLNVYDAEWMQLYNIIMRRSMDGLKLQLIGRNLFDAMQKVAIREFNLEIWPGYVTSFRQHEKNMLLCCDIVHKVMRHEQISQIMRRINDSARQEGKDFKTLVKNELLGAVVLTDYNNKTYRIDDIDFDSNPRSLFPTARGDNMSYVDYYKSRYNIIIKDVMQPLLISKPTDRSLRSRIAGQEPQLIKLIPELCRATGITDQMKNNRKLMTAMAGHTRINPEQRISRLQSFQKRLCSTPESAQALEQFNVKLDSNLIDVPGRILPEPTLVFANNQQIRSFEWEQCFRNNKTLQGCQVTRWFVIIPNQNVNDAARNFARCCQTTGAKMGVTFREPEYITLPNESIGSYSKALEVACNKDPQLVMVYVNSNRADLYSCIKKKMTCDRAVPSQVIRIPTITRPTGLMSVATKVVVQINTKLCFAPWTVVMPTNVMCIGFDVCHSTRDATKSYGALVASMDVNLKPGVYFSAVSQHVKGVEMSNDIALNVVKALRQYQQVHQKLPSIIFFYRDGVGEGQLHQVFEHEVQHVIKTIDPIYKKENLVLKICYIVVSKRINTRLFADNGRAQNPQPGTVVDDVITLPQRYDFFLISQSIRQGTVSPTSYNVLYDSTRLPVDRIQDMTYRQTHLYYNFFATVQVPAVCQYAHKLAFLVGQYLHQTPNPHLEKHLYFL